MAAAGNSGQGGMIYPGMYPEVIAVAAARRDKTVSDFSSRGDEVDVAAPGEAIYAGVPGGQWKTYSGTSMAAPFVTGLLALVIAYRRKADPAFRLTPDAARALLTETATDIDVPGRDRASGYGLVNPRAVFARLAPPPQPPVPPVPPAPGYRDYTIRVRTDGSAELLSPT